MPVALPSPYPIPRTDYLYSGNTAVIPDEAQVVIRESTTLRLYWRQATEAQRNPAPVPTVDFDTDMVIFVASGGKPQGTRVQVDSIGFALENTGPDTNRQIMRVFVSTIAPCEPFPGESYPVQFVLAERTDLETRFVLSEKACSGLD